MMQIHGSDNRSRRVLRQIGFHGLFAAVVPDLGHDGLVGTQVFADMDGEHDFVFLA